MQIESTANIKLQERTERAGYKKTKLGWIPKEWSTPTIPEVFKFLRTTSFSRNQMNYEESDGVYCIHYGDIHATYKRPILDFIENRDVPKINDDVELPLNIDLLEDGDLIIADASEDYEGIGTAIEITNLNGKEVLSGLHTFAFRDDRGKTVQGFRSYLFRNPQVKKVLKTIATGSKVYGVSKGNLEKFRIVLPTPTEQQKIAKILNTWDTAIEKQEQLIAAKKTFKKGLMQVLLTGKKRFLGFKGEWSYIEFGLIAERSKEKNKKLKEESSKCIELEHIVPGAGEINGFTDSLLQKSLKNRFYSGDILFGKLRPYLRKYWFAEFDGVCSSEIWVLRGKKNKCTNRFLFYMIQQNRFIQIANVTTGSKMPRADWNYLAEFPFPIPSISEQQKIANTLNKADKEIELLKQQLVQLQEQKRGLMQRLLTGAVRVKI